MTKRRRDSFFVGWSGDMPNIDRRFMLGAGVALIAGGAGLGAALGPLQNAPGDGAWDQGAVRQWTGLLLASPYPMLRTLDLGGGVRTAFLATSGKTAVRLPASLIGRNVTLTASLIQRGDHAMLAAANTRTWIEMASQPPGRSLALAGEQDLGPVAMVGEILDAKCWFGAMRPGYGVSHKACATLCARSGLPLAFCTDACGAPDAPLFLNEHGHAHARAILPFVADPVFVTGRRVRVGDITQFRAPLAAIRRL